MVDASIGGKTGVDLGYLKNQIGIINTPQMVLVDTSFLDTLTTIRNAFWFSRNAKTWINTQ